MPARCTTKTDGVARHDIGLLETPEFIAFWHAIIASGGCSARSAVPHGPSTHPSSSLYAHIITVGIAIPEPCVKEPRVCGTRR